ncbi:MAG: hypothetical protein HN919_14820 [Verrucomicrobia bacterium]|jgi:hypothetical protein|nr:hypothetical protein [Verrucomicrobiota bacterium]MBT7067571.1 hypothetical protein [Verrucomicrobiota bacterium]MBT7700139.1 hypothetical protein [Verrucomicrobiota bacterium]
MTSWIVESRILAPSLLSFAAAIGLHIVVGRIWRRASLRSVLGGPLAAGILLCALWLWVRPAGDHDPGRIAEAVAALALYAGLAYTVADLYGFHRTAIRLRALRLIHRNGGAATRDELLRVCGHEATVDQRLAQYLRSGDLVLVDGRYRMARRRILHITRGFRIARRLLLGTRPGRL